MTAPVVASAGTSPGSAPARRRRTRPWGLAAALVASAALCVRAPSDRPTVPPGGRTTPTTAWPRVQQTTIRGTLDDGPIYHPLYFLDVGTSVGTAPTPDGSKIRLLLRGADGSTRQLRQLSLEQNPQFTAFTVAGDQLAWAESVEGGTTRLWLADLRTAAPPRELTSDTGNPVFYDSQYDLVIADGRLHWAAASASGTDTDIRSVPLTGGPVDVQQERGTWGLTAWPWLVNAVAEQAGATTLRNLTTHQDIVVPSTGTELTVCSPTWCRVMVMTAGGDLVRIDLMRPDGTRRQRIAGSQAAAAITDVAPLDRFEVLAEPDPNSDLTGTQHLLVYDLARKVTVDLGAGVNAATYRGGVLWWSTGNQDTIVWHILDLRTA